MNGTLHFMPVFFMMKGELKFSRESVSYLPLPPLARPGLHTLHIDDKTRVVSKMAPLIHAFFRTEEGWRVVLAVHIKVEKSGRHTWFALHSDFSASGNSASDAAERLARGLCRTIEAQLEELERMEREGVSYLASRKAFLEMKERHEAAMEACTKSEIELFNLEGSSLEAHLRLGGRHGEARQACREAAVARENALMELERWPESWVDRGLGGSWR